MNIKAFTLVEVLVCVAIVGIVLLCGFTALDSAEIQVNQQQKDHPVLVPITITVENKFVVENVCYVTDLRQRTFCIAEHGTPPGTGAAMFGQMEVGRTYKIHAAHCDWNVNMEIIDIAPADLVIVEAEKAANKP